MIYGHKKCPAKLQGRLIITKSQLGNGPIWFTSCFAIMTANTTESRNGYSSSIQTLTVGSGFTPAQSCCFQQESRTLTADREFHPALKNTWQNYLIFISVFKIRNLERF